MLEEEQEFAQEEGEAEDNINYMEDEVDLSFLTQEDYEEALMNENIMEGSLYQEDDQEGYNLRSIIVSPVKKSPTPIEHPAPPTKKIDALQRRWLLLQNNNKGHYIHHPMILFSSNPHHKR